MKHILIGLLSMVCLAVMPATIIGHGMTPGRIEKDSQTAAKVEIDTLKDSLQIQAVEEVGEVAEKPTVSEAEMYERTVDIIKKYESLHRAEHWPYIGYGHKVRKGDKYAEGVELSKKQADLLLRKDLDVYLDMYKDFGRDAYLLAALAYTCGHGRVNKSTVLAKLKRGDRDIRDAYLAHSRAGGKFRKQLYERRVEELESLYIP